MISSPTDRVLRRQAQSRAIRSSRSGTLTGAMLDRRRVLALCAGAAAASMSSCASRPEGEFVSVNGDRQWLLVSGQPTTGPILLVLHGGPGGSETVLFRHFNRALEQQVRMAYWDQRGAGRSYDPQRPPARMTVAQFVEDLAVMVQLLRDRYGVPVILLGHSWGSALGLLFVHAHPNATAAFVGVAPVADQAAQEAASYGWARSEARTRSHRTAQRELEDIGEPPFDVPKLMIKNRWVEAFGGTFAPGFGKWRTLARVILNCEASLGEVRQLIAANHFSLGAMWPEVRTLDVPARVPAVSVPVAFLLGRHDRQCPSELSLDYFERLECPAKEAFWFERSAHNPPFEEPDAFNLIVSKLVRQWT